MQLSTLSGVESELRIDPDAHVELARVQDAGLVFVGYGIVAPEYGWDDYKDADLRGKIAVILNFNPPFAGEGVRLWYGRWDYKYLTAAAHGIELVVVVLEDRHHRRDALGADDRHVVRDLRVERRVVLVFQPDGLRERQVEALLIEHDLLAGGAQLDVDRVRDDRGPRLWSGQALRSGHQRKKRDE